MTDYEQAVLMVMLRFGRPAYGMEIHMAVNERINKETSIGKLYITLEDFEDDCLVTSWWGDATPERGGRPKKYFDLTEGGRKALSDAMRSTGEPESGPEPQTACTKTA